MLVNSTFVREGITFATAFSFCKNTQPFLSFISPKQEITTKFCGHFKMQTQKCANAFFQSWAPRDNCQDSATMFSEQIIVAIRCGILESLTRCCEIVAATLKICHVLFFVQIITYFVLRLALVKIKKFKVTSTSYKGNLLKGTVSRDFLPLDFLVLISS